MKLILTGGFLGSGKTTGIVRACQALIKESVKVAVITNDQGSQQVDSEYVKASGIPHAEVADGCFCCKYDELNANLSSLIDEWKPDVIFAEAVGSCADLVATVAKPLKKYRPDLQVIVSVFVDVTLLWAILEERASFINESVRYIFKKQIEEADILILNKKDCVSAEVLESMRGILAVEYPATELFFQNSLDTNDVNQWVHACLKFQRDSERSSLDIDYQIYAMGEAELAWGDQVITIESQAKNAVEAASYFIGGIFDSIQQEQLTIGHLKFFLTSETGDQKVSFTTMSTSASVQLALPPTDKIRMTINARIQASATVLASIIGSALDNTQRVFGCAIHSSGESFFSPSFPIPAHRM